EQDVGIGGKDLPRTIEMLDVVIFATLHPRGGRAVPLPDHLVASGRRLVLARRLDGVQHHAGDVPMHGGAAETDLTAVSVMLLEPLRTGWRKCRERLDGSGGQEHRDVAV